MVNVTNMCSNMCSGVILLHCVESRV